MADDKQMQVSLGCGTLILIALIVLFFSGGGTKELEGEIRSLQREISQLKTAVDAQSGEMRLLQAKMDRLADKVK